LKTFTAVAINNNDDFIFGHSPHPVSLKNGLIIGGGEVYPEINFTLPNMIIDQESMGEVRTQYSQMIMDICKRAVNLHAPGLVVEFELLPDLTIHPEWGAEITKILRDTLDQYYQKYGLKSALRVTPNDIREFQRPPLMDHGRYWEEMVKCFELCSQAGADLLSIESTGGKEIHDQAILNSDLATSVFALGVLASRDMAQLWDMISGISHKFGIIPAGDSACGFANTAMVLAEGNFIPRTWAALLRVLTVPRSLVAFEHGAIGPNKDCAYEGVYIKAITGFPIALEGAEAACAHLSPIGNITKAVPDLWSNESVQNTKLLGGMAPTVSIEQLLYATRLMNVSTNHGKSSALSLRDWYVESDSQLDPQAYVLKPDLAIDLSKKIIQENTPYLRTRRAAIETLTCLRAAADDGSVILSRQDTRWLNNLSQQADQLPENEEEFIDMMLPQIDTTKVVLHEYGL
jgi:methanol---5-hydroxybenzimidazolylcobamide Co-methyltransferase